ncbi:hypothetical protein JMJ35_004308 [Cladonia borealis]|uniref:Tyrosine specific protein phosphatases domain-containing protein n=1 Tax=Cladonia borealis TaxID=184061 RepID=A0AA39R1S0_9LECA|nr:hypothetical protein JMJ35_004308 [Cladonia borealis]
MSTLPAPPFITVPAIHNFRALHLPQSTHPILYRSAALSTLTPTGISTLQSLHITKIYDLRSHTEAQKHATPAIGGIRLIHTPVFSEQDYSPEAVAIRYKNYTSEAGIEGFVAAYTSILESGVRTFTEIFTFLRDAGPGEKCLVHCSAGKDRTGVLCALVLMLAGCGDEEVADEYALSEVGLKELKPVMVERLMAVEGLDADREGVERMVGSRRENMLATVGMIEEKFGGVEGYLRGRCGFGEGDLDKIRSNIVGGNEEEPGVRR